MCTHTRTHTCAGPLEQVTESEGCIKLDKQIYYFVLHVSHVTVQPEPFCAFLDRNERKGGGGEGGGGEGRGGGKT